MKKRKSKINKAMNSLEDIEKSRLRRTLIFTIAVCVIFVSLITYIQLAGENKITVGCSYLDPPFIDYLAFFVALFLVIEGFARIFEHPNASLKRQLTRITRIVMGSGILTLHIIQFVHK